MQSRSVILGLALFNFVLWTLLPVFFESGLRVDVAEAAAFGPEFLLSYPKHPPLSFWLTALASKLGPFRNIAIHGLGAAFATFAFFYVADYCRRTMSDRIGVLAMVFGLASPFAAYLAIQFNHNVALMPFWALTIVLALDAFEHDRLRDWVLLAIAIGLGLWAKYAIALLCLPLAVAYLMTPRWRRSLRSAGPYVSFLIFAAIAMPQVAAAIQQGGGTFKYAFRVWPGGIGDRALNSLSIIYIALLANALIYALACVAVGLRPVHQAVRDTLARCATREGPSLLFTLAAFGPVLVIFYAAFFGVRVRTHWFTPISLGCVLWWAHVLSHCEPLIRLRRLAAAGLGVAALYVVGYFYSRLMVPNQGPLRYPEVDAARLTEMAEAYWRQHNSTPLRNIVIVGEQRALQIAGTIAFNSNRRILVRFDRALPFRSRVVRSRMAEGGALMIAVGVRGQQAVIPAQLGPFAISNIEKVAIPRIRGRGAIPDMAFGVGRWADSSVAASPERPGGGPAMWRRAREGGAPQR